MKDRIMKSRWQSIDKCGHPPKDNNDFYGDRYSVPVLVGNSNTGQVSLAAYLWDYDMIGWVKYDLSDGPDPEDYEVHHVDYWALWPTCKLVCLD